MVCSACMVRMQARDSIYEGTLVLQHFHLNQQRELKVVYSLCLNPIHSGMHVSSEPGKNCHLYHSQQHYT